MKYSTKTIPAFISIYALSLFFAGFSGVLHAGTIVRMEFQQGSTARNIDIHLSDSLTPLHVNSFLKYVDAAPVVADPPVPSQSYDGSFIHSIAKGALVEGGKFHFSDTAAVNDFICTDCTDVALEPGFVFPAGLQLVTTDVPIDSEFLRSNTRGTIAMKKASNLVSNTKSSPGHWYINLTDNSADLDIFTGVNLERTPFTVFGEVVNDTLASVEAIENKNNTSFPAVSDIHFDFEGMPVVDFDTKETVTTDNLVRINSVRRLVSISSDIESSIDADTDFGIALLNDSQTATLTVSNVGSRSLTVSGITSAALSAPYFISSADNNCNGVTLAVASSCTFKIEFTASNEDTFDDSLVVDFTFGDGVGNVKKPLQLAYKVKARAALILEQNISASVNTLDFAPILSDTSKTTAVNLLNSGTADLSLFTIEITGKDESEFAFAHNCNGVNPLNPDVSCFINVTFSPVSVGNKEALLTVTSDDPDTPSLEIVLTGFGDSDTDGVSATVENAAPNNGDNNTDGDLDSLQNHVASLTGEGGVYYSISVEDAYTLNNVRSVESSELPELPEEVQFTIGATSYEVNVNAPGEVLNIGIILPAGIVPTSYYMFGIDITNETDTSEHWFSYANTQIFSNVVFTSPEGVTSLRNVIQITVRDGGVGDFDGATDGRITIGPAAAGYPLPVVSAESGSSGAVNLLWSLLLTVIVWGVRRSQ